MYLDKNIFKKTKKSIKILLQKMFKNILKKKNQIIPKT